MTVRWLALMLASTIEENCELAASFQDGTPIAVSIIPASSATGIGAPGEVARYSYLTGYSWPSPSSAASTSWPNPDGTETRVPFWVCNPESAASSVPSPRIRTTLNSAVRALTWVSGPNATPGAPNTRVPETQEIAARSGSPGAMSLGRANPAGALMPRALMIATSPRASSRRVVMRPRFVVSPAGQP